MGKKRKSEVDLEAERTLYTSFVAAANSVSQLYTQAVQQQRKTSSSAARGALEKVVCFLLRDFASADYVPKAALLQFLQHEFENLEGGDSSIPCQFPVPLFASVPPGADDTANLSPGHKGRPCMHGLCSGVTPGRRGNRASAAVAMDLGEGSGGENCPQVQQPQRLPTIAQSSGLAGSHSSFHILAQPGNEPRIMSGALAFQPL